MRSRPTGFPFSHPIVIFVGFWVIVSLFLASCTPSKLLLPAVVPLGSAEETLAHFRSEGSKIKNYRALGKIEPASGGKFVRLDLMVHLTSNRLIVAGMTPFGLPLFRVTEDQNGVSVQGFEKLESLTFPGEYSRNEIGLLREVLNVYDMGDNVRDAVSFVESETHYILSRMRLTPGCFAASPADGDPCWGIPVRTYWVEKRTLNLVKKEIYAPIKKGEKERILIVGYSDFRPVALLNFPGEALNIPFAITLMNKGGEPLAAIRFHEVRLDDEDSGT